MMKRWIQFDIYKVLYNGGQKDLRSMEKGAELDQKYNLRYNYKLRN